MPAVTWAGPAPEVCDFSADHRIVDEFVDGATVYGPWANMCMRCFREHGRGLGTGRGQHYRKVGQVWTKVGG